MESNNNKTDIEQKKHKCYPTYNEIDAWVESIFEAADKIECSAEIMHNNGFCHSLGVNHAGSEFTYVKFSPLGMDEFYGYWQPVLSGPAPLLVHVPGYGAEMSTHPELIAMGYNVLHISPLGYTTPEGPTENKKRNSTWPVLADTVISHAQQGYKTWLVNCVLAIKWAMGMMEVIPNRISFFGTSQGGGTALLLGSLYKDKGVRCVAADVPFLTNFPMGMEMSGRGAYILAEEGLSEVSDKSLGWKSLGYVDTTCHAYRLTCPVLLTAGGKDETCPPETIESLYQLLSGTKSLTFIKELTHRYSREFIPLASAWFRIYA